jgi:hypothetical protein
VTSFKEQGYDIDMHELEENVKSEWLLYFTQGPFLIE